MHTCNSWEDYMKKASAYHTPKTGKVLNMAGFFNIRCDPASDFPDQVHGLAAVVESLFAKAFPSFQTGGIETPDVTNPAHSNQRYSCLIMSWVDRHIKAFCNANVNYNSKDNPGSVVLPSFSLYLPFDNLQKTAEIVYGFLPYIESFADIGTKPPPGYSYKSFGPHHIVYMVDGDIKVVGQDVFRQLPLPVPVRKNNLVTESLSSFDHGQNLSNTSS